MAPCYVLAILTVIRDPGMCEEKMEVEELSNMWSDETHGEELL